MNISAPDSMRAKGSVMPSFRTWTSSNNRSNVKKFPVLRVRVVTSGKLRVEFPMTFPDMSRSLEMISSGGQLSSTMQSNMPTTLISAWDWSSSASRKLSQESTSTAVVMPKRMSAAAKQIKKNNFKPGETVNGAALFRGICHLVAASLTISGCISRTALSSLWC